MSAAFADGGAPVIPGVANQPLVLELHDGCGCLRHKVPAKDGNGPSTNLNLTSPMGGARGALEWHNQAGNHLPGCGPKKNAEKRDFLGFWRL